MLDRLLWLVANLYCRPPKIMVKGRKDKLSAESIQWIIYFENDNVLGLEGILYRHFR